MTHCDDTIVRPSGRPRPGGFTLVELILVVAVIVVLAAILLPLGARLLATARGLHCQNNLRQLGTCLRQYYADNGNVFPPLRATGRNDRLLREMADDAGLTLSDAPHIGGYHWSIILWPYHRRIELYVCPCDPNRHGRGDLFGGGVAPASPFRDAPPESYALNSLLFRSMPTIRRRAGASWGSEPGHFQSEMTFTTLNDQKRMIPRLDERIVLFCGATGFTVGHASNTVWRDTGLGSANRRYEWHPWPGPEAFEDRQGHGAYYLFFSGAAEYRDAGPSRFEWALDLE